MAVDFVRVDAAGAAAVYFQRSGSCRPTGVCSPGQILWHRQRSEGDPRLVGDC